MYIVLSGRVGIYIDGSQSGEDRETGRGPPPTDLSDVIAVNQKNATASTESSHKMAAVALAIHAAATFTRATKKRNAQSSHVTTNEAEEPPSERDKDSPPDGATIVGTDVNNNVEERKVELDRSQFGRFVVNFSESPSYIISCCGCV